MVAVRKRAAISYKEPTHIEGLDDDENENLEQREEAKAAKARKATPSKPRARKRPAPEAAADDDLEEEASLLGIVKKHGASIAVAAKDWVDRYGESRGAATAELMSFLLQACGVDRVLSEEEVEEGEVDALKQELDKQAQEEGLDDQWRGPRAAARAFRANYLEMWDKVVREASGGDALWDQYLLDRLTSLLVALNTSVVRDFRSVATLTAAQLVTSWIGVRLALGEARDTAERQLAAEEKKKGRNPQRVADFKRTRDRCHTRVQELKSYTDSLFQGVFAHRFRDCCEDIRATVVEGIGTWVRLHPAAFLTDQYLKYIAWALSDKDARVRLASVTALLALYSNPDNGAALADFTQRFAQRFGELFYDADERVAVKGVQLNTLLVRLKEAQPSQFVRVYELLADESAGIRHAVAELVASALQEQGRQLLQAAAATKSAGKKPQRRRKSGEGGAEGGSDAELQLAGLLQVVHLLANPPRGPGAGEAGVDEEGEEEEAGEEREVVPLEREVVALVVDALFDRVPVLSDWHLLLSWARQGTAEEHFGEAGVTNLLHLLRDSLHRATGGSLAGGGGEQRAPGGHKGRERKEVQASARQDATLALMKELPGLLRKVQTDPSQAAALVGLIPEMQLEVYALKRQEAAFSQLAGVVKDTFLKHADVQVARECVAALAACAAAGPDSIKDAASLALSECTTDVASGLAAAVGALERAEDRSLRAAAEAFERSGGEEESQLLYDVRAPLVRLQALLELGGEGAAEDEEVYDALHALLENTAAGGPLPAPVVLSALRGQLLVLLWRLRQLDLEFPEQEALQALARERRDYATQLESIAECSDSREVRDRVTEAMADLLLVFSGSKLAGSPLAPAAFSPSDQALAAFWEHCQEVLLRPAEAEDEAQEDSPAFSARAAAQRAAAHCAAKLVVFQAVPQHTWLAAQLLSHWVGPEAAVSDGAVRRWAHVAEVVKETARLLKKADPAAVPAIYLDALKAAHSRMPEEPVQPADNEEGMEPLPLEQEFLALSDRIAKTYAGFNSSASAVEHIIVEGTRHAVSQGPQLLSFLEGVAFFVRSLPARSAEAVLARVEEVGGLQGPDEGDEAWATYFAFLDCLFKRAAKGRVKSVLKTAGGARGGAAAAGGGGAEGGGGGGAGASARKGPRKISFAAPRDEIEGESEGEEEEERERIEEAEDDDAEQPTSLVRVLQRGGRGSSGGGGSARRSRLSGMTPASVRGGGGRRGSAVAAAAVLVAAEEEVEEEGEEGGTEDELEQPAGQRVLGGGGEQAGEQGWSDGEQGEEDLEEEEEEAVVLPTEEAMAIPGSTRGAAPRQRRLHALYAQEEEGEEEAQQAQHEADDDADLLNVYGGTRGNNNTRSGGGGRRQAPVVDVQPQLAAAEEEEEEERPARRRRR